MATKSAPRTWIVVDTQTHFEDAPADKGREFVTRQCHCGRFYAETADGVRLSTGCPWSVAKFFKQGHDAKLKSLLIEVGARGLQLNEIYYVGIGRTRVDVHTLADSDDQAKTKTQTERTPEVAAKTRPVAWERIAGRYNFAHMVQNGVSAIANAKSRKQANAVKQVAKKTQERKVANSKKLEVKVGRWWYSVAATENNQYVFITKQGEEKRVSVEGAVTREV